jgi:hypothetical protein
MRTTSLEHTGAIQGIYKGYRGGIEGVSHLIATCLGGNWEGTAREYGDKPDIAGNISAGLIPGRPGAFIPTVGFTWGQEHTALLVCTD